MDHGERSGAHRAVARPWRGGGDVVAGRVESQPLPKVYCAGFWDSVRIDRNSPISEESEPNLVLQNSNIPRNLTENRPKLTEIRPIRMGPNFFRN